MRITPALRKEINAAVRQHTRGACPGARVGLRLSRDGNVTGNALLWPEDSDLFDDMRLADVKTIDDDPANPGCVELDLYVDTGMGYNRELETNVGILIRDGHVVFASDRGRVVSNAKAGLGFPTCPWDNA